MPTLFRDRRHQLLVLAEQTRSICLLWLKHASYLFDDAERGCQE